MNEDKLNTLRQQDTNLRDAIMMDEMERPQMPADLNARLMKRVAVEEKKARRIVIWPWLAAACVAGVMVIWLTPPKDSTTDVVVAENTPKVETPVVNETEAPKTEAAPIEVQDVKAVKAVKRPAVRNEQKLIAQETPVAEPQPTATSAVSEAHADIAMAEKPQKEAKPVTLTERDIPITRPENYKYTPEELALMKKQANEAYLKWAQLELEIAKHNLGQTAQK